MELTFSTAVGYLLGIMVVFVIAKICLKPLKFIIKIVLNSVIGGAALLVLNTVGKIWGIHIGINAITSVIVGILGLPAVIMLLILQIFF